MFRIEVEIQIRFFLGVNHDFLPVHKVLSQHVFVAFPKGLKRRLLELLSSFELIHPSYHRKRSAGVILIDCARRHQLHTPFLGIAAATDAEHDDREQTGYAGAIPAFEPCGPTNTLL